MQTETSELKNIKLCHIFLSAILGISLILQSYKLKWGLVTDNIESAGLTAFHIAEPKLVHISYTMMQSGDLNPHHFIEPSLFYNTMYVVFAIVSKIADISSFTQYMWVARIIAVSFTVATVLIVYLTGREISGNGLGLLSALLMAINPYYLWFSSIAKEDSMMVFLVTLAMYLFTRYLSGGGQRYFLLSMFAAGLAGSAKYPAGMLLPFLAILYFYHNNNSVGKRLETIGKSLVAYVLAFVAGTPYSLLSTREFLNGAIRELTHYTTGHPGFEHFTWFVHIQTITGLWDAANIWGKNGYGLSLILVIIGVSGILPRLRQGNDTRERYMWYMVIGWILLSFTVFGFLIKVKMGNQMMILTPAAMIVAGFGFQLLLGKISPKNLKIVTGGVIILLIFTYAVSGIISSQNDNRYYAARWLDENVEPDSSIATTLFVYLPEKFTNKQSLLPGLQYLENSTNEYIILSSWEYERYLDSPGTYPAEAGFYQAVLSGNTNYKQVAQFKRSENSRERTLTFGLHALKSALAGEDYRGEVDIYIYRLTGEQ